MNDAIYLYETATGNFLAKPRVTSYSWTTGLNDTEATINLECAAEDLSLALTEPWSVSVALVAGNGTVLAAGPIYTRSVDLGGGKVKLVAGSFWTLLKRRVWQSPGHEIMALTGTRSSLKTMDGSVTAYRKTFTYRLDAIATAVIKDVCSDLPGVSGWTLASGSATRTYDGLEVKTVADIVADFFRLQTPPLMRFDAVANVGTGAVKWAQPAVLGTTVTGNVWFFDASLPGVATEWSLAEDAGGAANAVYQASQQPTKEGGSSSPQQTLFARHARTLSATVPHEVRLESVDTSHGNVTVASTLESYAVSAATAVPYASMKLKLARSDVGTAAKIDTDSIVPGDVVEVGTASGFFGAAVFRGMVESISGDAAEVTLSVERGVWVPFEDAGTSWTLPPAQSAARGVVDRVKQLDALMRKTAVKLR